MLGVGSIIERPTPEISRSTYRKTVLNNGIRIVTESVPGVRSLSIGVVVECGSAHETAEEAGLAHLCEHLVFQGTSTRDGLKIARQIDDAGGRVGGFTTRDYTCYSATVVSDYCFHALDLLGDILLNPTFPEDCLERERRVAMCEIGEGSDDPSRRVHDMARGIAWRGHPLGRLVAGEASGVARYTREDLIYFFHKHYTPNRVIIAAAGDLDHDDFVSQARDAFWRMLGDGFPPIVPDAEFSSGVEFAEAPLAQTYFCLSLPAPAYQDAERYSTHLLNRMLGGNVSSRLFRRLREDAGLVYGVHSEYLAYRNGGMLSIEGSTQPDMFEQTIEELLAETRRLLGGEAPADLDEWWRARTQVRAEHLLSSEDSATRMMRLATQESYFGRWMPAEEVLEEISAVEADGVDKTARRVFPAQPAAAFAAAGRSPLPDGRLEQMLAHFLRSSPARIVFSPNSPS